MSDKVYVLGLLSGSSLDGLDMALCEFAGATPEIMEWALLNTKTVAFSSSLAAELSGATTLSAKSLFELEVHFSNFCSQEILKFSKSLKHRVDYISSHGHTVYHFPDKGYTLQIGKGSIISEQTGIPCIADLRSNDIALGGEGAPVAPIVEQYLYPGYDLYFNLGGIANFSIHHKGKIVSIDSCPCNQVLNFLANQMGLEYDKGGNHARSGSVQTTLLDQWSTMEYFNLPSPKSMDNSWVQQDFINVIKQNEPSINDGLATMVEFCAIQLTKDINKLRDMKVGGIISGLVTGGGAFNSYLIERMSHHFKQIDLSLNLPNPDTINFKEAILMALMGYLRIKEIPNTIPTVTGASGATIGGALYLPSPFKSN